jgi:hypothetical protein
VDAFGVDVSVLSNNGQQSGDGDGSIYYQLDSGFTNLPAVPESHFAWHYFAVAEVKASVKASKT